MSAPARSRAPGRANTGTGAGTSAAMNALAVAHGTDAAAAANTGDRLQAASSGAFGVLGNLRRFFWRGSTGEDMMPDSPMLGSGPSAFLAAAAQGAAPPHMQYAQQNIAFRSASANFGDVFMGEMRFTANTMPAQRASNIEKPKGPLFTAADGALIHCALWQILRIHLPPAT